MKVEPKQFIRDMAEQGVFPENVTCPNRCKFCYEFRMSELYPKFESVHIPRYTNETFELAFNLLKDKFLRPMYCKKEGDCLMYFPKSDAFSLGLSPQQLEEMIKQHRREHDRIQLYTTGLEANVQDIKYLVDEYDIGIHLSIITYDPAIRSKVMNKNIDMENVVRISKVLKKKSNIFLIYFNKRQILSDLEKINRHSVDKNVNILIHKLFYNRLDSDIIVDYAKKAENDYKEFVYHIKENKDILQGRTTIFFPESEMYAFKFRKQIRELLNQCNASDGNALFCSYGAYSMIKNHFNGGKMTVIPVKNVAGGNTDFTQSITVNNIMDEIEKLKSNGVALNNVYLPGPIFSWGEGKFDLNGDGPEKIKERFPEIESTVIDIPMHIIKSHLNLQDCIDYFEKAYHLSKDIDQIRR